jgi:hypothetical protein
MTRDRGARRGADTDHGPDRDDHDRLTALFEQALALPAEARAQFVAARIRRVPPARRHLVKFPAVVDNDVGATAFQRTE